MQTIEMPLDNTIKTFSMDDLIKSGLTERDKFYLAEGIINRQRKNARRLKNWTGAHHVEIEVADEL
jgi:hypothetical protein